MVSSFRAKNFSPSAGHHGFSFGRILADFERSSIIGGTPHHAASHDKGDDAASNYSITSTASSSSVGSSDSTKSARRVTFYPKVTVYPCREKLITVEDRRRRWITKFDLESIKDNIRSTASHVLEHHELRVAMDRLHELIRRENFYIAADVDDDDSLTDEDFIHDVCSGMCELDLARILIDSDTRGVERMILARLDACKGQMRPVTRHSRAVMQTQASNKRATPDERAEAIARQCRTGASSKWASILGRADAEAVSREFMLQM